MRKINMTMMLLAGFLTMIFLGGLGSVTNAEVNVGILENNENQVLNDEGYGNEDVEYYNSEDDRANDIDEEPAVPQENSLNHA